MHAESKVFQVLITWVAKNKQNENITNSSASTEIQFGRITAFPGIAAKKRPPNNKYAVKFFY